MSEDDIFERLTNSQRLMTVMLQVSAEDSSARVGAWNLRDIAAHLAATERECYEPRIRAIASGENPSFDVYTKYGDVSVDRYLEIALEHDRNHLRGLERLAGQRTR